MNRTALHQEYTLFHLPDPRQGVRYESHALFAVTDRGTGKITNISENGLAFGCLYPNCFADTLFIDILDVFGTLVKQVLVKKVWEKRDNAQGLSREFELEIGVEFLDLTTRQDIQLRKFLEPTSITF